METPYKPGGGHKTIHIIRNFPQPPEKIWEAWTSPQSFKKWWGPGEYSCPDCSIDLKVGGTVHASMLDKKTGKKTWALGTYQEIIPEQKLVYRDNWSDEKGNITPPPPEMPGDWSKEQVVTVKLAEANGKTELELEHTNMPAEAYEDCINGWQGCLDKMEGL